MQVLQSKAGLPWECAVFPATKQAISGSWGQGDGHGSTRGAASLALQMKKNVSFLLPLLFVVGYLCAYLRTLRFFALTCFLARGGRAELYLCAAAVFASASE